MAPAVALPSRCPGLSKRPAERHEHTPPEPPSFDSFDVLQHAFTLARISLAPGDGSELFEQRQPAVRVQERLVGDEGMKQVCGSLRG
jgi:hypothetical protein